jgi:hypothetical protein
MYRIEINIHEKELCVKMVIYKDNYRHSLRNNSEQRSCHVLRGGILEITQRKYVYMLG